MNVVFLMAAALFCAALTYVGGVLYTRYQKKEAHQKFLPSVIAAGGGYLLAISFLELLPMSIERHRDRLHEIAGLALFGVITVSASHRIMAYGLRAWRSFQRKKTELQFHVLKETHGHLKPYAMRSHSHGSNHDDHDHSEGDACCKPMIGVPIAQAAIGCVVVCSFFDGVMVTSGFQAGEKIGLGIYIGQLLHAVPEGIIAASLALASGQSAQASRKAALFVGSSFLLGSLFPFLISAQPIWVLPFSLGIALSVTLGQLLPMISKRPSSWAWLAGGAGFYTVVHLMLEH